MVIVGDNGGLTEAKGHCVLCHVIVRQVYCVT